jgi:hypothetical protein
MATSGTVCGEAALVYQRTPGAHTSPRIFPTPPEHSVNLTSGLHITRVQVRADNLIDNCALENTPAPLRLSVERELLYGQDESAIDRGSADGFSEHRASRHRRVGGLKESAEGLLYHLGLASVRRTALKKRLVKRDVDSTHSGRRPSAWFLLSEIIVHSGSLRLPQQYTTATIPMYRIEA